MILNWGLNMGNQEEIDREISQFGCFWGKNLESEDLEEKKGSLNPLNCRFEVSDLLNLVGIIQKRHLLAI